MRLEPLSLFPRQASSVAERVDDLFLFLVAVSVLVLIVLATLIIVFIAKYRRRASTPGGRLVRGSLALQVLFTLVPLAVTMVIFVWSARIYGDISHPPAGAMQIGIVGRQWLWIARYQDGRREINELHVPAGRRVKLSLSSEDVIHSFSVPAFRLKAEVVPGRTTTLWFEATTPGRYRFFCAEYCGTSHSRMAGEIVVLEPSTFQHWLEGHVPAPPASSLSGPAGSQP